ncbi:MAG: hypothetical protein V2I43_06470 [Parvularcula sp.]|jgi:hypothetical protein|nr:hypothetical protein [Parvularcula sp.]
MRAEALVAWTSLYIAVGCMALICAGLAAVLTAWEWRSGAWHAARATLPEKVLFVPKLWLRWQLNYLKGAPAIIAIALFYAADVGFSVFWNI